MSASNPIIRFDGVTKRLSGHNVLSNLSFEIQRGETAVLMGASGCGKTTVLRCINGLEHVDAGHLYVHGTDIVHPPRGFNWNRFRANIGLVFQQYNLFPHLTVLQNITLGPIKVKHLPRAQAEQEALAWLARVNLENKAHRYPANLSGGEKQRAAIARALAMSADILLLDEPTSALDPLMRADVLDTIRGLSHLGITLVIVTHEVSFALRAADRILFLHNGQVALEGPPSAFQSDQLQNEIAKPYFAALTL